MKQFFCGKLRKFGVSKRALILPGILNEEDYEAAFFSSVFFWGTFLLSDGILSDQSGNSCMKALLAGDLSGDCSGAVSFCQKEFDAGNGVVSVRTGSLFHTGKVTSRESRRLLPEVLRLREG